MLSSKTTENPHISSTARPGFNIKTIFSSIWISVIKIWLWWEIWKESCKWFVYNFINPNIWWCHKAGDRQVTGRWHTTGCMKMMSWWAQWHLKSPASRLFAQPFIHRHRSKKTSKLCVTGLCAGNSLVTGESPAQMSSTVANVPIWWRHHGVKGGGWRGWMTGDQNIAL